ncbi:MAG: formyl transferase [Pseudorhodoplanes sp.]
MRILLCLNRDLFSNVALNLLMPALAGHDVELAFSQGVGKPGPWLSQIGFMERDFPFDCFFPMLARLERRGQFVAFEQMPFAQHHFANINSPDSVAAVRALAPDLIVSIRYGQIFRDAIIAVPPNGVINLHSAIRPDHRGVLGTFWALLAGDRQVGCTLHHIDDKGIDTGRILNVFRMDAQPELSLFGHLLAIYEGGVPMVAEAIRRIAAGEKPTFASQSANEGAYHTYPTAADVVAFASSGRKLYDSAEYNRLLARYIA